MAAAAAARIASRGVSVTEWIDKDGYPFHPGAHYWVGGNTKVYGAILFRMREEDFGEVRHHGADHGHGHQKSAKEASSGYEDQHGAYDFDGPCQVTEPLAHADRVEQLDHLRHPGQLGRTGGTKSQGQENTNAPDDATLGGGKR